MLGKSVLPRVLVRVTLLLLPAHLPVLIGLRVSHSGRCECVCVCARAIHTHTLNTYLRKLESWDQYGGMYVCMFVCVVIVLVLVARARTLTLDTHNPSSKKLVC